MFEGVCAYVCFMGAGVGLLLCLLSPLPQVPGVLLETEQEDNTCQ